jgi:hypothetical protein
MNPRSTGDLLELPNWDVVAQTADMDNNEPAEQQAILRITATDNQPPQKEGAAASGVRAKVGDSNPGKRPLPDQANAGGG